MKESEGNVVIYDMGKWNKEKAKELFDYIKNYNPFPKTVYFGRYVTTVNNYEEESQAMSEMYTQTMKDYEDVKNC